MTKMIFDANIKPDSVSYEDGGQALILDPEWKTTGTDENIFLRIQSWDESILNKPNTDDEDYDENDYDTNETKPERALRGHKSIHQLIGKKVRVTIEILED